MNKVEMKENRYGKIYLAGPMTGYENYNFDAFNTKAKQLRELGYIVENPAEHGVVDGAEWVDYLRYDISKLVKCETLYLLNGWEKSKGALLEVQLANSLGMDIVVDGGIWTHEVLEVHTPVGEA